MVAAMSCPTCETRKPRRSCPALGAKICPVCCGTKRVVEIACPADCVYLASSRTHPPAQLARRRERDLRFVAGFVGRLPERALHLLFVLQDGIARHAETTIPSMADGDVAEAAATLAATYETAARGIIFEHQARSVPAQRLARSLHELIEAVKKRAGGTSSVDHDAALALRRIEQAARTAHQALGAASGGAYLELLQRLPGAMSAEAGGVLPAGPEPRSGEPAPEAPPDTPRIVLP
jgi:hypothetical protein